MPPKKKRAPAKKRKYTQKQKQKQKQSVNVKVSTGGGGGGTSFIPMPTSSAPQFDVNQLIQGLGAIRPPPIVPASIAGKVAESQTEEPLMSQVRSSESLSMGPPTGGFSQPRSDKGKPRGSYKEKQINVGRNIQNEFVLGSGGESQSGGEPSRVRSKEEAMFSHRKTGVHQMGEFTGGGGGMSFAE